MGALSPARRKKRTPVGEEIDGRSQRSVNWEEVTLMRGGLREEITPGADVFLIYSRGA